MFKKHNGTDKTRLYMNMCFFHYALIISHKPVLRNTFYAILCVKFVREVRYFTSKVAIFSLFALGVRKVTGSGIIG